MNDLLRNIPSVTELLDAPAIKELAVSIHNNVVVESARIVLEKLRSDIRAQNVHEINHKDLIEEIAIEMAAKAS